MYIVPEARRESVLSGFATLLSTTRSDAPDHSFCTTKEPILKKFLSNVNFEKENPLSEHICSFPSLCLKNNMSSFNSSKAKMTLLETAAFNLAFPIFADKDDIENAPGFLIQNLSSSLHCLIEYRMKSSISALFKALEKNKETVALQKILTDECSSLSFTAVVTSFRTLPKIEAPDGALYLPLVLEATVDISFLGVIETISFSSPGTIFGNFNSKDYLLERVEILFDTVALLQVMMKHARHIVRKVIARATGIAFHSLTNTRKLSKALIYRLHSCSSLKTEEY